MISVKRDDGTERAHQPAPPEQSPPEPARSDVALICGATPDGQGVNVLRCRDGVVSAGAVRPLAQGQPIHGEVVRLSPRSEMPRVCDVEVQYTPPASKTDGGRKGPAQVASDVYRKNWDAVFKRAERKSELAN
jgi:hypothetical protein